MVILIKIFSFFHKSSMFTEIPTPTSALALGRSYVSVSFCELWVWDFFFLIFGGHVLFVGLLIPMFWTSGDVCSGFQSQAGSLACFLTYVILRFTSGATPAVRSAWQLGLFNLNTCKHVHKHWWRLRVRTHNHPFSERSTVYHSTIPARLSRISLPVIQFEKREPSKPPQNRTYGYMSYSHSPKHYNIILGFPQCFQWI